MTSPSAALPRPASSLLRLLLVALLAVAVVFFGYALVTRVGELAGQEMRFAPGFLILGTLCIATAVAGFGVVWRNLLDRLEGGPARPAMPVLRAFAYTWPARYVPGTVPFLVARMEMTRRLGYRRSVVAASLLYENVLQLGTALVVSMVLLLAAMGRHVDSFALYGLVALPLIGGAVLLHPRVLAPTVNRFARRVGHEKIGTGAVLPTSAMIHAAALYAVFVGVNGLGFFFVMNAVTAVGPEYIPAAIGIYNLAGVIGVLTVFVPSGLGVREAIIGGLVGIHYPIEVAAASAVLARVAAVAADGLPAAFMLALDGGRRLRGQAARSRESAGSSRRRARAA